MEQTFAAESETGTRPLLTGVAADGSTGIAITIKNTTKSVTELKVKLATKVRLTTATLLPRQPRRRSPAESRASSPAAGRHRGADRGIPENGTSKRVGCKEAGAAPDYRLRRSR